MPSVAKQAPAYTRILLEGIPYWKDAQGAIYYYESSTQPTEADRICLGTEGTGLVADWEARLAPTLSSYREGQQPRGRAPAAAAVQSQAQTTQAAVATTL
jgi:hypothetical protein